MTPVEAARFIDEEMVKTFPLGDIKLPNADDIKTIQAEK
jgi:2-oxoglutarate/2-oxoacid ferredoxin oxidoreductase subunit beta